MSGFFMRTLQHDDTIDTIDVKYYLASSHFNFEWAFIFVRESHVAV